MPIPIFFFQENADEKAHPPVPVEEFAHYVNEMKENDYDAFQKEYDVSTRIDNILDN